MEKAVLTDTANSSVEHVVKVTGDSKETAAFGHVSHTDSLDGGLDGGPSQG